MQLLSEKLQSEGSCLTLAGYSVWFGASALRHGFSGGVRLY